MRLACRQIALGATGTFIVCVLHHVPVPESVEKAAAR